jgi:adenine-specific DNA-methyltransferase
MLKSIQEGAERSHRNKKLTGSFYTPGYIVQHIVRNTVGRLCAGKTSAEVATLRILDPACGTGAFLLGAYRYLLDWHSLQKRGQPLTLRQKQRILANSIYGVDVDEPALRIARGALLSEALQEDEPRTQAELSGPSLWTSTQQGTLQIRLGNALPGFDSPGKQTAATALDWRAEFPEVMRGGGFDVVIGNPPYGAALSDEERRFLAKTFRVGTTDTAALLMLQAYRLTKPGGWNGFIVPKPFTYSSNWKQVRALLQHDLIELVDAGKAWPDVKLEQVIYILQKGKTSPDYAALRRKGESFLYLGRINKEQCDAFGFYVNGVTRRELALANKIRGVGAFLSDFTINVRGAMLQGSLGERGPRRVIGGKQIQPFHLRGQKGFLPDRAALPKPARVQPGSILVQNIVAHIHHPIEHIQIIGAVVSAKEAGSLAILDTVNQLTNRSWLSSHFLLALLSSRLLNWYVYRFIFAKAIRTLHFDGPVSRRIPIPNIDLKNSVDRVRHRKISAWAELLATLYAEPAAKSPCRPAPPQQRIRKLRAQIDQQVYQLYGLTPEEIVVVEEGWSRALSGGGDHEPVELDSGDTGSGNGSRRVASLPRRRAGARLGRDQKTGRHL